MNVSVRLNETDGKLYKLFAEKNGMTLSEFLRSSAEDKIKEAYEKDIFGIEIQKKITIKDNH